MANSQTLSRAALTPQRIGRLLRAFRKYRGITLVETARRMGVLPSRLHHWEVGQAAPPHVYLQIAEYVLVINPAFLVTPDTAGMWAMPGAVVSCVYDKQGARPGVIDVLVEGPKPGPYPDEQERRLALNIALGISTARTV